MSLQTTIHNERTKLTANWLNTVATALLAAGVFAPFGAVVFGLPGVNVSGAYLAAVSLLCVLAAIGLHLTGRHILGRLRE